MQFAPNSDGTADRRRFLTLSALGAVAGFGWPCDLFADPGDGHGLSFDEQGGQVVLVGGDLVVNGVKVPRYSWAWIGLAFGEGVCAGRGDGVFGAVSSAVAAARLSLDKLLADQFTSDAQRVVDKPDQAIRQTQADLSGFIGLCEEYAIDPTPGRLDFLIGESRLLLSQLATFNLVGYRSYMIIAGLRLSYLQAAVRQAPAETKIFERQRAAAIAHHEQIVGLIDAATEDPLDRLKRFYGDKPIPLPALRNELIRPAKVLAYPVPAGEKPWWSAVRRLIKAENTDFGEKIVTNWLGGKARR